jgi:hypothetical protein
VGRTDPVWQADTLLLLPGRHVPDTGTSGDEALPAERRLVPDRSRSAGQSGGVDRVPGSGGRARGRAAQGTAGGRCCQALLQDTQTLSGA